jgi:hypothetical protein
MALLDFRNLSNTLFHSLCDELVKAEYPSATKIEGSGGDEGIDCFAGNNIDVNNLHVFQHKFFTNTLSPSAKQQIKESLTQVLALHPNISTWTLVIAKDFTPGEIRWFDKLRGNYPSVDLQVWDNTKLKSLLRIHYRLFYEYFPLPSHVENRLSKHLDDLKEDAVKPLIR